MDSTPRVLRSRTRSGAGPSAPTSRRSANKLTSPTIITPDPIVVSLDSPEDVVKNLIQHASSEPCVITPVTPPSEAKKSGKVKDDNEDEGFEVGKVVKRRRKKLLYVEDYDDDEEGDDVLLNPELGKEEDEVDDASTFIVPELTTTESVTTIIQSMTSSRGGETLMTQRQIHNKTKTTVSKLTSSKPQLPLLSPCPSALAAGIYTTNPEIGGGDNSGHSFDDYDDNGRVSAEPKVIKKGDQLITSYVDEETGRIAVYEVGVRLEVGDLTDDHLWYPAKIVEVDTIENEILVHFENWSSRFDEWIKMDSPRLRPSPNTNVVRTQFEVGEKVEALWSVDGQRYPGIIQIILPNDYYQVLFDDGIKLKKKYNQIFKLRSDGGCTPESSRAPSTSSTPSSTSSHPHSPKSKSKPIRPPPALVPAPNLQMSTTLNKSPNAGLGRKRRSRGLNKASLPAINDPDLPLKTDEPSSLELEPNFTVAGMDSQQIQKSSSLVHYSMFAPITTDLGKRKRTIQDYSALLKTRKQSWMEEGLDSMGMGGILSGESSPVVSPVKRRRRGRSTLVAPIVALENELPAELPLSCSSATENDGTGIESENEIRARDYVDTLAPATFLDSDTSTPTTTNDSLAVVESKRPGSEPGKRRRTVRNYSVLVNPKFDEPVVVPVHPKSMSDPKPGTSEELADSLLKTDTVSTRRRSRTNSLDPNKIPASEEVILTSTPIPTTPTELGKRKRTVQNYSTLLKPRRQYGFEGDGVESIGISPSGETTSPTPSVRRRGRRRATLAAISPAAVSGIEELAFEQSKPVEIPGILPLEKVGGMVSIGSKDVEVIGLSSPGHGNLLGAVDCEGTSSSLNVAGNEVPLPTSSKRKRTVRNYSTLLNSKETSSTLSPLTKSSLDRRLESMEMELAELCEDAASNIESIATRRKSRSSVDPNLRWDELYNPNRRSPTNSSHPSSKVIFPSPKSYLLANILPPLDDDGEDLLDPYAYPTPKPVASSMPKPQIPELMPSPLPKPKPVRQILSHRTRPTTAQQKFHSQCLPSSGGSSGSRMGHHAPRKRKSTASRKWRLRKAAALKAKSFELGLVVPVVREKVIRVRKPGDMLSGLSAGRLAKIRRKLADSRSKKGLAGEAIFKDVSVDIINCSCGLTDEHGLMVQCELCQCWQHGNCFGIEDAEQMPSYYVCESCRYPDLQRASYRADWTHEFQKTGCLPKFSFATGTLDPNNEKIIQDGNELLDRLHIVRELIHSTHVKISISEAVPDHPKIYQWHKPHPTPAEETKVRNFNKVYRPVLKRLLRTHAKDMTNYKVKLRQRVEVALRGRDVIPTTEVVEEKVKVEEDVCSEHYATLSEEDKLVVSSVMSDMLTALESPSLSSENGKAAILEKSVGEKLSIPEEGQSLVTLPEKEATASDNLKTTQELPVELDLSAEGDGRFPAIDEDLDAACTWNPDRLLETIGDLSTATDDPETTALLLNIFDDLDFGGDAIFPTTTPIPPQPKKPIHEEKRNLGPAPPVRITPELCRVNLVKSIAEQQDLTDKLLDEMEQKILDLEVLQTKGRTKHVSSDHYKLPKLRKTVKLLLSHIQHIRKTPNCDDVKMEPADLNN